MSSKYERKIIIVGKAGHGKSSLGNVLLDRRVFDVDGGCNAVTEECKMERNVGNVSVVDTPGLFDCNKEKCLAMQALEIQKAINVCPNPHAFLIVLNGSSRLTKEELSTIDVLRIIFGEQCIEKAIIVLTHHTNTDDETKLKEQLEKNTKMIDLIEQCSNRYVRIDNRDPNPEHVNRINTFVDKISRAGKYTYENNYLYVHGKVLEEALQRHDSGQVHEQVKRLSEQIRTAVEEEIKKFKRDCLKVAAGVGAVCVTVGTAAYYAGGAKAVAKEVSDPQKVQAVIETSINTVTRLIRPLSHAP